MTTYDTASHKNAPQFPDSDILIRFDQAEGSVVKGTSNDHGLYAAMQADIHQVEILTQNVRGLIRDCDDVLTSEGLQYQIETLERCVDYYRRGILAAKIINEFGGGWLQDMQARLRKAVDEQHRWDGEGGNYLSEKQHRGLDQPIDKLTQAADRVEEAMLAMNKFFPLTIVPAASERVSH